MGIAVHKDANASKTTWYAQTCANAPECTNDDQFECKIDESDVSVEENDSEED
jgi:hypothetical protein